MTHHITLFHNGAILPIGESVRCESDPSEYLGEPDIEAGSIKIYKVDENLRVVVSVNILTVAP